MKLMNGLDMNSCYWQTYIATTSAYLDDIVFFCFVKIRMSFRYTKFNVGGMNLYSVIMSSLSKVSAKTKFDKSFVDMAIPRQTAFSVEDKNNEGQ